MPPKAKPEAASRSRESQASLLSEFVRQGTESFFATQRILLDLATRQNTTTVDAIRDRLYNVRTAPIEALTEMAGEGLSNFIAAQRVLLNLAQRQNELLMTGVVERTHSMKPVGAMAELLRRGVDTFIDMQQHFLTMVAKQADVWVDNTKSGKALDGKGMPEIIREAMENFIRSQKKFLDAVAEETAHATGEKDGKEHGSGKKTEVAELARQGMEAFIDVQKKLLDLASQQVGVNVKVTRRAIETLNPLPPVTLAGLTKYTVDSFVAAQKALLDAMAKPAHAAPPPAHPHKPPASGRKRTRAAAAVA
jgi:hypothetical protein